MKNNADLHGNSIARICQTTAIYPIFFSSLQVSSDSAIGHLTGWRNLWNKLLKEPGPPNIAEVIDTCMKVLLLLVFHELIPEVEGGQDG